MQDKSSDKTRAAKLHGITKSRTYLHILHPLSGAKILLYFQIMNSFLHS